MLSQPLRTWTAWVCLAAVALTTGFVPKGSAGDSALVLCVGCERSAIAVSGPCSITSDCCDHRAQIAEESVESITGVHEDCACVDVSFPALVLPFAIHAASVDHMKLLAYAPVCIDQALPGVVMQKRLQRRVGAMEPPWQLVPSSRAVVLNI